MRLIPIALFCMVLLYQAVVLGSISDDESSSGVGESSLSLTHHLRVRVGRSEGVLFVTCCPPITPKYASAGHE
ncbi:hypothetical protein GGS20DRAFT_564875 [Poronia punctata]|nr:hypothetical protein GGS20DRAFT_564875 [Poronia punctata]